MANIGVNSMTGQVAVAPDGVGPQQSNVRVYEPGQYKINLQTRQIAVPSANGQFEVHDLSPDQMHALNTPEAIAARHTGGSLAQSAPLLTESALRGAQQGVTLGTSDEIGGAVGGLVHSALGDQAPVDPAHPVTGGMSSNFVPNYLNSVGQERAANTAAKANNPKAYKGALFGGSLLPAMAMPANTILQAGASGAAQGGILGAGLANTQDPRQLAMSAGMGAGMGGLLGAGMRGLQSAAFDNNTATGLAHNALSASAPGGDIGNIVTRPSSSAAELDPGMANLLRTAASMNSDAGAAAIPAARDRMGNVNQAIIGRVGQDLSPLDAGALGTQLEQQGSTANAVNYGAVDNSPTRVGLVPAVSDRNSFQAALRVAQAAAQDEMPPRNIDPTNLSGRDMDLIDKALQSAQRAAGESHGETGEAAQISRALIPTRGQAANQVRQVADAAFPELQHARSEAARNFGQRDAIPLGATWLGSGKSAEQVGAEFNALPPDQQQTALAGFATAIRNLLGTKTARTNLGQVFEKTGLADKLRNVGMPDATVNQIIRGGAGARDVLNALEGGSMTARNIAGKEALQSTLSSIKPGDVTAAAVTGSPAVAAILPILRNTGARSERQAAALIVNALTRPGSAALASIVNRAPQTWGGLLNAVPRTAGSLLGGSGGFGQRYIGPTQNVPRVVLDQGNPQ